MSYKTNAFVIISSLIAASTAPGGADAATGDGQFAARGWGAQTCGSLVQAIESSSREAVGVQLTSWITGYISYANRQEEGIFDKMPILDNAGIATIVARICSNNPESYVEPVMWNVLNTLSDGATTEVSEAQTIEYAGNRVTIRTDVLRSAQEFLERNDYLSAGSSDGVYGSQTRNALSTFQEENELDVTGVPDALTLFVLFGDTN